MTLSRQSAQTKIDQAIAFHMHHCFSRTLAPPLVPISLQQMVFLALLSITDFPTINVTSFEDILTTVEVHGLIGLSSNGLMMMDLNIIFHVASCFS